MINLVTEIQKHILKEKEEHHPKDSFWCTESETDQIEIFWKWKGEKETNPDSPHDKFALEVRKMVEVRVIDSFKDGDQHRVEIDWEGIRVTGYMDGILNIDGVETPIEVKTSYGNYQKQEIEQCKPKLSYLKQLAFYMTSIKANKGILFYVHFKQDKPFVIDGIYQFVLEREGSVFRCHDIEFNLMDTFRRFKRIHDDYISKDIEPPCEFVYKYDLDKIDWKGLPKYQIANARSNKAVLGDWQVQYSRYKNKIIAKLGQSLGYSQSELNKIAEATKGYTTW